jgi:branched-subunit amino acid ABC-type transport system permease component
MSFDVLFNQFMSGIARSALLFLVASGLSLTFGVLRVLNFAHGTIYMLGAFITYSIWKHLLIPVLAFLIMAGIGLIIEFFLLRHLYSRGWPEQLLATYAVILIITDIVKWGWDWHHWSSRPWKNNWGKSKNWCDHAPLRT